MKRFHIHVSVNDLAKSIGFYSTLFGAEPSKIEADYAKWMLDDPRMLTETAEKFFRAIGYEVIDRRDVADEIKQSAEFRSLCPASAVCMSKLLTRVSHG